MFLHLQNESEGSIPLTSVAKPAANRHVPESQVLTSIENCTDGELSHSENQSVVEQVERANLPTSGFVTGHMTFGAYAIQPFTLYVGDLHKNFPETTLYELFYGYGCVHSVRICRDYETNESLGYGYVNFTHYENAKFAMEKMNFHSSPKTFNRALRVMWKNSDPSIRRSGEGNIFIKGLEKSIDSKQLHATFQQFGSILSSKVAVDSEGCSLGYGFAHFASKASANDAIKAVNGMLLLGKKVYIGPFIPRSKRKAMNSSKGWFTNIYIKHIDAGYLSEDGLKGLFSSYGEITSIYLPKTKDDNAIPLGFAFVNFKTPESAKRAIEEMNGKTVGGQAIYVNRAQKLSERRATLRAMYQRKKNEVEKKREGRNLYVKNLTPDVNGCKLKDHFSRCGTITSCIVMRAKGGVSRGVGFVCYSAREEAKKAVSALNKTKLGKKKKPIFVSMAHCRGKAERKEMRRKTVQMYPMQWEYYATGRQVTSNSAGGRTDTYATVAARFVQASGSGGAPGVITEEMLNEEYLAQLTENQCKTMLGTILLPKVTHISTNIGLNQGYIGKITGMLLELDISDVRDLIKNEKLLEARIDEAVKVLNKECKKND